MTNKDNPASKALPVRLDLPHKIIYRPVKNIRLSFRSGQLELVLPAGHDPAVVLQRYASWINRKVELIRSSLKENPGRRLSERTETEFRHLAESLAREAAGEMDVQINRVLFRLMKTKWASCSSRGNLMFNRLMRYLPESLIEYVVFHEVVHLRHWRHDKLFKQAMAGKFPQREALEKELFAHWFLVQSDGHG